MKKELDVASPQGDLLREQLSALADGEALPAELAIWSALVRDDGLLESWADYQRIGDVMRGGSQLVGQSNELAFLASFRERLAADQAGALAPAGTVVPFPASVAPAAPTAVSVAAREPANDGVYRWKMVAGLAAVMTVLVVGWAALEEPGMAPAVAPATSELAQQSPDDAAAPVAAASSAVALLPQGGLRRVSQPGLVVERDGSGTAGSRYALQVSDEGVDSLMIRDPRLDEFLAAHRQGSVSALQSPVDFVRDVVVQPAP